MATNNRSQVYLDANDNISKVINQISASVAGLNASLARMGNASNGSFSQMNGTLMQQLRQLNQIDSSIQGIGGNIGKTAIKFAGWAVALVGIKNLGERCKRYSIQQDKVSKTKSCYDAAMERLLR